MKPIIKTIIVEWRKPRTPMEKKCWGVTNDHGDISHVFIRDSAIGRGIGVDTFFHEMTHAFFNFHESKMTRKEEEQTAQAIGRAARGLINAQNQ